MIVVDHTIVVDIVVDHTLVGDTVVGIVVEDQHLIAYNFKNIFNKF